MQDLGDLGVNLKKDVDDVLRRVVTKVLLFVWAATTFVVALAGPFGTFVALTFPHRFGYWAGVIGASMALAIGLRVVWRVVVKAEREWVEDALVIASLALCFGPMVTSLNMYLWPNADGLISWQMISYVTLAIGLATVGVRYLMRPQSEDKTAALRDRLLDRIDAPSDAVADIDDEPGFCVHRSHWVAISQIGRVEVEDGREVLQLTCGEKVPIGPTYHSNLIDAGVLSA